MADITAVARRLLDDLAVDGLSDRGRSNLDQLQALARQHLAELGVDIADPDVAFHGLAWMSLIVHCAHNGHDNGQLDENSAIDIAALCRALATALGPFVPGEVRQ